MMFTNANFIIQHRAPFTPPFHRFIVVIDSFCMTKINSLPSANEHEKLGANQGSTSDLFCNNQGKLLFSVQP